MAAGFREPTAAILLAKDASRDQRRRPLALPRFIHGFKAEEHGHFAGQISVIGEVGVVTIFNFEAVADKNRWPANPSVPAPIPVSMNSVSPWNSSSSPLTTVASLGPIG